MLDVHPPHESAHSWRDILIHLATITVGLLIALSLEGVVEWQHHRHLVHAAEASLHAEIKGNASNMDKALDNLHQRQAILDKDVSILNNVVATGKLPADHHMAISFDIIAFDSVSWKTAQTTGALSYMQYDLAQEYASIYMQQELLVASQNQAARDAIVSVGYFVDQGDKDDPPTREDAKAILEKIGVLQGQLMLVDSLTKGLNDGYKQFLAQYPN